MARGGQRQGAGGNGGLRTTQTVQAPAGENYGDKVAMEDAQRAIPLENTAGVQNQMAQGAPQGLPPSGLPSLGGPTARPNEPITSGIAIGPGAGPEALANPAVSTAMYDTLAAMARITGSADLEDLAQRAQQLGQ